jgi:hypothetical protein
MSISLFKTREFTNKLLEAVDEGYIDPRDALTAALSYMSEAEVKDMCAVNEFFAYEEDEEEEDESDPLDDFNYVGSRHHY